MIECAGLNGQRLVVRVFLTIPATLLVVLAFLLVLIALFMTAPRRDYAERILLGAIAFAKVLVGCAPERLTTDSDDMVDPSNRRPRR